MTIYAIVNGFISPGPEGDISDPVWILISPTAILQGGNPYFVPDLEARFEARIALALRIGKLGKGIAPRFAHRYIESVAPAVLMADLQRLDRLRRLSLPWTSAISYDRSLALGKFRPMDIAGIEGCACSLTMETDASDRGIDFTLPIPSLGRIEDTIEAISHDNTLKTGDILLLGIAGIGPQLVPGQRIRLYLDGEETLRFNVR